MSDSVSEKSETCEKFEIESDHSDKFDSEKNWKPTSVEEWFESNGRRAKAQQKIKVLNYFKVHIFHEKKTCLQTATVGRPYFAISETENRTK